MKKKLNALKRFLLSFSIFEKRWLDKVIKPEYKETLRKTILDNDSPAGVRFDKFLIYAIVMSVLVVIIETIPDIASQYKQIFHVLEWVFTIIFTIEYFLRIYVEKNSLRYMLSFFGIVDLLSIIPAYVGLFFVGSQQLLVLKTLRLLRIFRIFKLGQFVEEGGVVVQALVASRTKIYVFISFILLMAILIGTMLFMVEGSDNEQFRSIPHGIYWAIVTLTTVGYGDIAPITPLGRMLATVVMIMGYGVIAVPTGIVTAEISNRVIHFGVRGITTCSNCGEGSHVTNSAFCHSCGEPLIQKDVA